MVGRLRPKDTQECLTCLHYIPVYDFLYMEPDIPYALRLEGRGNSRAWELT